VLAVRHILVVLVLMFNGAVNVWMSQDRDTKLVAFAPARLVLGVLLFAFSASLSVVWFAPAH
jgi:hypothetical protein